MSIFNPNGNNVVAPQQQVTSGSGNSTVFPGDRVIVGGGSGGGGGIGGITVENEGTALTSIATVLNFTGTGVTATGTGATKIINIPGVTGSTISTYADNTAYALNDIVYYEPEDVLYRVRAAVAASNTVDPPHNTLMFEPLQYLTREQADAAYLANPPAAEALLSTIPGNATTIAARADATGTVRVNSFIDSSTPQIGFFADIDFGNFPPLAEQFNARSSTTQWSELLNGSGAYRNIAMNFGSSRTNAFLQAFYNGQVNGTVVEIALFRNSTNYAIYQLNGGYYGAEGNVVYFGRTAPTLVTSQGLPGNSNLAVYINLTSAGAITRISTPISGTATVIGGDGLRRQVDTSMIEDDAITAAKLAAPANEGVSSPLTVDNGGISQDPQGRFRLSRAFTDSAGVLALDMGYVVTASASAFNSNEGLNGQFFFSTNGTANDVATLLAADNPSSFGDVRSIVMARNSNDSPSRSIAGLVSLLNVGSILEVHTNQGDNFAVWTITGVTYVGGDSNINTHAIIFRVENTPRTLTNVVDDYGTNVKVGMRDSGGSIQLAAGTGYGIVIHGEDKVKDGRYLLPDSVGVRELDVENTPVNAELIGYTGGEMRWLKNIEGIYNGTWQRINREGNSTDGTLGSGDIAFLDTYLSAGNGTGHYSSTGDNWSTVSFISINPIEYVASGTAEDARLSTGRLRVGSRIKVTQPGTTNLLTVELVSAVTQSEWNTFWSVTVLESSGTIPSQSTNLQVYIYSSPEHIVGTDDIIDNSVTGPKLNVTQVTNGTTRVLSRNEDNGRLEEGPYATFSGGRDGIVPGPAADVRPDPDTLTNAIQTQPLRFTTNTQGIITGARGWELLHNGSVVTSRPTMWSAFDHSSDDVGLWITTEDLTAAERARLAAYGLTLDTGTIEMLLVNAEDHNSWMLCNMRADLTESGDDTLEVGDLGTGMYVSVGDGNFSVVASQGVPSDNLKFYFPVSLTGTVDLSETTPATDRFVDAAGNWVEPALNRLETLSDVLETQITPFRLVGYSTSSPTLKYKQWDTKIDGHIYHYTVFYTFSNGVVQTAQVYQGHFRAVPTGDNATSFLFGTRTYTTTNGVTTWSDSI